MRLAVVLAVSTLALASSAIAQEVIATHGDGAPAAVDDSGSTIADARKANGDWARRVMAGQPTAEDERDAAAKGCQAQGDGKPHGEVWAGVGTGGYRNVGGVVTQPLGDCASATIAINHTEFDAGRRGRRR